MRAAPDPGSTLISPSQRRQSRRRGRGFTLIELLIATSLLAVLALLAWRGLDSVLNSRQRIVEASDELRSLTLAFAQLDDDLRKSWAVRLLRLPVPAISFSVAGEQTSTALLIIRESGRLAEPTQVQQVAWRVRNGVLERGFGAWTVPSLTGAPGQPARPSSAASDAPGRAAGGLDAPAADGMVWQPILARVASMQMQGWIAGQGWMAAENLAGQLQGYSPLVVAGQAAPPGANPPTGSGPPAAGTAEPPQQPPQPAQPVAAAAGQADPAMVTGLQVRIVREDGQVLQRVLPVKD